MATKFVSSYILSLTLFLSLVFVFSMAFTPQDNFLINCGSTTNAMVDGREFLGDSNKPGSDFLSSDKSITLSNPNRNLSELYSTARVFTSPSTYGFGISKPGTHLVRLQFSPFNSQNFKLSSSNFSVSLHGSLILNNFRTEFTIVKEFILMVDETHLDIMFDPLGKTGFAFVNAIEVFSAPIDLIVDGGAKSINADGVQEFKNLSSQILETVHRINVGGSKLTPFNDTLWRNWVPDEQFLAIKSSAKIVTTTQLPNYQKGGASKEVAPENVYMTAQEMNRGNLPMNSIFNLTWGFPIDSTIGVRHFVRLHFCDIVSLSVNQLYFNVFINGFLAYKDLDLSLLSFHVLASPFYADFVIESDHSGVLAISVGPSDLSTSLRKNAILNGVEVMKIVNPVSREFRSKKKHIWILIRLIVGILILLSSAILAIFILLKLRKKIKKKTRRSESNGWTPLRVQGGSTHSKFSEGTHNITTKLKIPFVDLQSSTNNFDKDLIIGSGGFGIVYKAILRDNFKVAVKRGVPGSRQGLPEFHTEITILSKIRHRHLVSLVGFCEEQSEMILVYEYMENGPLKNHLYGSNLPPLSWKKRLEICIGAARGLHYLHTGSAQGIIHRDVKSTNILLDDNFLAKVADFGLSRSGPCLSETHVSTGVKGSFGYLDPEYFRQKMSKRSSSSQLQTKPSKPKRNYSLTSSSSSSNSSGSHRLHTLASKYVLIPSFVEKMLAKATITCPELEANKQAPKCKWIKGRRFQAAAGVEYVLPNDMVEQERLHSEHLMLTFAFQGLFSAPVDDLLTTGARVLDIGCGPGGWVLDMAKNYPRSYFVGIDISDQFPTEPLLRSNAEFSVANAAERLPFPDGSFDYIHQRLLSFSLTMKQWDTVMSEIRRLLKPGGYVELTELDCDFQRWGSWGRRAKESFHSYIRSRGIEPSVARQLSTIMTNAQLSPKHTSYISMPLGRWGGKLGVLFADDVLNAIGAMEPLVVDENVDMSLEDFGRMCKALMDEWEQCRSFANYFKCYGQKESL